MKRWQLEGVVQCKAPHKLAPPDPAQRWDSYYTPFSRFQKESVLKSRCRLIAAFFIRRL